MYRGHVQGFFTEALERYNLVGYSFDPTKRLTALRKSLVDDCETRKLNASKNLIVTMSYGNTLMHSAILYAIQSGRRDLFARSYVLSLGFVVAGAATYFKSPEWVPGALTQFIKPWGWVPGVVGPFLGKYGGLVESMNPRNPEQSNIAQNITAIREATAGMFYVQANQDPYVDLNATASPYARNRDLILKSLDPDHLRYITPPSAAVLQNHESPHDNILFAPEVKAMIRDSSSLLRDDGQCPEALRATAGNYPLLGATKATGR
jgi:hypothetical protein